MKDERASITLPLLLILLLISFFLEQTSEETLSLIQLKQREHELREGKTALLHLLLKEPTETTNRSQVATPKGLILSGETHFMLPNQNRSLHKIDSLFSQEEQCNEKYQTIIPLREENHPTGFRSVKTCKLEELSAEDVFRTKGNLHLQLLSTHENNLTFIIVTGEIIIRELTNKSDGLALIAGGDIHIESIRTSDAPLALISLTGGITVKQIGRRQRVYSDSHLKKTIPPHVVQNSTELLEESAGWISGFVVGAGSS